MKSRNLKLLLFVFVATITFCGCSTLPVENRSIDSDTITRKESKTTTFFFKDGEKIKEENKIETETVEEKKTENIEQKEKVGVIEKMKSYLLYIFLFSVVLFLLYLAYRFKKRF